MLEPLRLRGRCCGCGRTVMPRLSFACRHVPNFLCHRLETTRSRKGCASISHADGLSLLDQVTQVLGQCGTKSASAIEHQGCAQTGYTLLDISLDDPLAEMNGSRQMVLRVFAFFANVDQKKFLAAVDLCLHLIDACFMHAFLGIFDDAQKTRGMLMCHRLLHRR